MTAGQVIGRADELLPNTCSREQKLEWLDQLDAMAADAMAPYREQQRPAQYDEETVLLLPQRQLECALRWMEMQIHYTNGEIARYNNAAVLFNSAFGEFRRQLVRTQMPQKTGNFSY